LKASVFGARREAADVGVGHRREAENQEGREEYGEETAHGEEPERVCHKAGCHQRTVGEPTGVDAHRSGPRNKL